jgi:hypothetical protein
MRGRRITVGTVVFALLVTLGIFFAFQRAVAPILHHPSLCSADADGEQVPLEVDQAGIAATIAGVAQQRSMPSRAVTIAYATAWQESKLTNLHYGDLDSVGVFQQRPSQGWGPARLLEDPVYATTRFLEALARVPHYRHLQVYVAAQDVQHSADGYAYNNYAGVAAAMAAAFTGRDPHAVSCIYGGKHGSARLTAAGSELTRTFGPLSVRKMRDPARAVAVHSGRDGWAVAAWLVSHAAAYGIGYVRFGGYQWRTSHSRTGWVKLVAGQRAKAPATEVLFG